MHTDDDSFRDTIATISKEGKRAWVFPKMPKGPLYEKRKLVSYALLLFLFSAPFIKINAHQFLLFNVIDRKFSIFGFTFWPQDFHIIVIIMITGVVSLALFTVAFGRIFCGWLCPQTIFMEMVFRRIEYAIEGDKGAQQRLQKQTWDAEKIRKKSIKWVLFFIISFAIANVFLAYLIGSDALLQYITQGPAENKKTFIALLIFTAVFYFIYSWFREQVCIIACPYGRLQGVLLDEKSIVVAYDYVRGEGEQGRAKFHKGEDRASKGFGDCIDCKQCITVCPTGIDIRNGTQLECTNCTACIDECNTIMQSVQLPKGLIRYASEVEIAKKQPFVFSARMKGYTAVLAILTGVFIGMLFLRNDIETTILRLPGQLFEHKGNKISNVYTYKIINKTSHDLENLSLALSSIKGNVKMVGNPTFKVKKDGIARGTFFIEINELLLESDKTKIELTITENDRVVERVATNFLGPRSFN